MMELLEPRKYLGDSALKTHHRRARGVEETENNENDYCFLNETSKI